MNITWIRVKSERSLPVFGTVVPNFGSNVSVTSARVANYPNKDCPDLEDFGDAALVADNDATSYFRVDSRG